MRIVKYTDRLCAACGNLYTPRGSNDPCCSTECRLVHYIDRSAGPEGCWPWTGALTKKGYAALRCDGRAVRVHRLVYLLDRGYLPDSKDDAVVRHTCDNRSCCNPKHLLVGTYHANSRDMANQGRGRNGASAKVKGYVGYENLSRST